MAQRRALRLMASFFLKLVHGAQTTIDCATAVPLQSGQFHEACAVSRASEEATDELVAKRLWDKAEDWVAAQTPATAWAQGGELVLSFAIIALQAINCKYDTSMPFTLGKLETQAFAYIQMRGKPTINSAEVARGLRITAVQTRDLLSRLARRNLIARVRRGLYLVPPRVPPGGRWSPSEFMALETLVVDRNGRYQVCGPTAFHRYGWDDQVPNRLYAYNNRLSGERRIGSATLSLIKVGDDRLGGVESFSTPDGATAVYSSRARSLVDAVYEWSRFGSLPRAYGWIRDELGPGRVDARDIVNAAARFGNTSTRRRIGKLLEREGVNPAILMQLLGELPATSALIPWCPTRPKRGTVDRRWGVVFNG